MNSKGLLVFAGIGFELVAMIWAAVYLGEYLKSQYGFGDAAVAFAVIGALTAWIVHILALLSRLNRETDNSGQHKKS